MKIILVCLYALLSVGICLGGQFQGKSIDLNSLEPLIMQKGSMSTLTLFEKSMKKSRSYYRLSSGEDGERVIGYDPQKAGQGKRQLLGGSDLYKRCVKSVVLLVALDATSLGSGSVLDEQGNILTNWHVVIGQDQMLVWPHDKKIGQLEDLDPDVAMLANVIAIDPDRDLAMLRLEPKSTIPQKIEIASIDPISIADDVFSIGHPEGYIWSFTYGVVSQIRSGFSWAYDEETDFTADVIQTQTPINPGNSGGPLFNGKGQLVGVNSFSYDGQGLNFAVHLREVNDFISKANDGKYRDLSRNMAKDTEALVWV
jgi:S1-C subfamily serine protease